MNLLLKIAILRAWLTNESSLRALLAHDGARNALLSILAASPEQLRMLAAQEGLAETTLEHPQWIYKLLIRVGPEILAARPDHLRQLVQKSGRGATELFDSEELLKSLVSDPSAAEAVRQRPDQLRALIEGSGREAADFYDAERLANLLASSAEVQEALLSRPDLVRKLFDSAEQSIAAFLKDEFAEFATSRKGLTALTQNPEFIDQLLEPNARALKLAGEPAFIRHLLADIKQQPEGDSVSSRLGDLFQFSELLARLEPIMDFEADGVAERLASLEQKLETGSKSIERLLFTCFVVDDRLALRHGQMRFPSPGAAWLLLHEILIAEEYFFEPSGNPPRILDCGAHVGFATYYFKSLYPESIITCFEPVPALRELLTDNVDHNGWENVSIEPYAVSSSRGTAEFNVSETSTLAGSLSSRRVDQGDTTTAIQVETVCLSEYLTEPVDLLKLDIEGAELDVLREISDSMHQVQNIICEVHVAEAGTELVETITLLSQAGFNVSVRSSQSHDDHMSKRPITASHRPHSYMVWASR